MTRLEAHFFKETAQKRDKKTIRAANNILKPCKIRDCKLRFSEHEPRKGTETTLTGKGIMPLIVFFQNMNPERGRKQAMQYIDRETLFNFSEHEPRKGTET